MKDAVVARLRTAVDHSDDVRGICTSAVISVAKPTRLGAGMRVHLPWLKWKKFPLLSDAQTPPSPSGTIWNRGPLLVPRSNWRQLVPLKCKATACTTPFLVSKPPAAHTLRSLSAATASNPAALPAAPRIWGRATTRHLVPVQRMIAGTGPRRPLTAPAPQMSRADSALTPVMKPGTGTLRHRVPSKWRAKGRNGPLPFSPKLHTSLGLRASSLKTN